MRAAFLSTLIALAGCDQNAPTGATCGAGTVLRAGVCVAAADTYVPDTSNEPAPDVVADSMPETTPDTIADTTPEATPETIADTTPETTPDTTPETTPDTIADATPETTPDTIADATPETTPDTTPETTPDTLAETTPETTPDTTPETTPDTIADTTPETTGCTHTGFAIDTATIDSGDGWFAYIAGRGPAVSHDQLLIGLYTGGGFHGATGPGTYPVDDVDFATCSNCVVIQTGCNDESCSGKSYVSDSGELVITDMAVDLFVGRLQDVVLREVSIDPTNASTTPIPGGETWCIDALSFAFDERPAPVVTYELVGPVMATDLGGRAEGDQVHTTGCAYWEAASGLYADFFPPAGATEASITELGIRCMSLELDEPPQNRDDPMGDATNDSYYAEINCDPGQIMIGIDYGLNSDGHYSGVAARCADIATWVDAPASATISTSWPIGTIGTDTFDCPGGAALVSLRAYIVDHRYETRTDFNGLQAMCRRLQVVSE